MPNDNAAPTTMPNEFCDIWYNDDVYLKMYSTSGGGGRIKCGYSTYSFDSHPDCMLAFIFGRGFNFQRWNTTHGSTR